MRHSTVLRFAVNGIVATAVHFAVLSFLIEIVHFASAGLANGIAALFGITASYLGNRMFVFRSTAPTKQTLPRFVLIYALVAGWHVLALTIWTDMLHLPYQAGYVLATAASMTLTFLGSRWFVFAK